MGEETTRRRSYAHEPLGTQGLSLLLSLCLLLSLVTPAMAGSTGGAEEEKALAEPCGLANPEIFNQEDFPYALENVLVKLVPDASGEVTPLLAQAGVSGLERLFAAEDGCWFLASLADGTLPPQALESLRELEDVVITASTSRRIRINTRRPA